ncbi:MAG: GGDEF domain-containing protein [Burkholderiaceae bacterium]
MPALDAPTLLLVTAVFNGFAAVAWCLLAGLFRIAPAASWAMAASHGVRILALGPISAQAPRWLAGVGPELAGIAAVISVGLMCVALRRMLRLRTGWRDLGWIIALWVAGLLAAPVLGRPASGQQIAAAGVCLLALLAMRDVIGGAGPGLARGLGGLMALPYGLLALLMGLRALDFAPWPALGRALLENGRASALMIGAWLLLGLALSIGMAALLIWRLVLRVGHLNRHDPLTDALNRRALQERLRGLRAQLQRGHGYAIVQLDLDHFKRINDGWGHAAGDAALLHCVALLRGCLRDGDALGRLGGEEFCVLLPHTSLAQAAEVAQRMRAALAARPLLWRGEPLALTASFGVVAGQHDDPLGEAGLALADQQVYRAKALGRNCVCIALEAPQ